MKTTKSAMNLELAQELLSVRQELKLLEQREKELKEYFSNLISNDGSLTVGTAIVISKHEQSRSNYDAKALEQFFTSKNIDSSEFKKTLTFNIIKIQKVG